MVDIIITGIGGQGTVSLGHLLAETLNELDIPYVAAETHGMSQRGGSVIFHLRIGKSKLAPIIEKQKADLIISGEPMEALRSLEYLKPDGIVLTEVQGILSPVATQMGYTYPELDEIFGRMEQYTKNIHRISAVKLAESIGSAKVANIVILGRILSLDIIPISYEVMLKKILNKWPRFTEFNQKALEAGFKMELPISN